MSVFFTIFLFSLASISLSTPTMNLKNPNGTMEGVGTGTGTGTCTYTMFVKTADQNDSTSADSVVSVSLAGNGYGDPHVYFHDLVHWGGVVKGSDRKSYFKKGYLDVFRGTGPCLPRAPCWMILSSEGTGSRSRWLVEYVDVITDGTDMTGCAVHHFNVSQWLATDAPPYQLYAIVNNCLVGCTTGGDQPERVAA